MNEIESHKRLLDALLQELDDAQLCLKLQKGVIGVPEIHVLGCIVGSHSVREESEKIKFCKGMLSPSTREGPAPLP